MKTIPLKSLLSAPAWEVAPRLLGCHFELHTKEGIVISRIVETEAYDQSDAASHSYRGRTPRTDVMFGPPGHLYVYFTYGMHYCCNIVTGAEGHGSAVLIRALEPLEGREILEKNRPGQSGVNLTNGPAKLCQAYGIDKSWNGIDLEKDDARFIVQDPLASDEIVQSTRIGISQAKDAPWRFYIRDNPYVSRA